MKFLWCLEAEEKKTIPEWQKETGCIIMDPDGFDRTDSHLYERLMTKKEFIRGLFGSTISGRHRTSILKEAFEEGLIFFSGQIIKTKHMELK